MPEGQVIVVNRVIKGVVLLLLLAGLVAGITVGVPMFRETFTPVVVAAVNLSPGMLIGEHMVHRLLLRRDQVPEDAVGDMSYLVGKFARERIYMGTAITPQHVTDVRPPRFVPGQPRRGVPMRYIATYIPVRKEDAAVFFEGDTARVVVYKGAVQGMTWQTTSEVVLEGRFHILHINYHAFGAPDWVHVHGAFPRSILEAIDRLAEERPLGTTLGLRKADR
jgi:hypothetical protein